MSMIIFLDVDGTLINYETKIPQSAKEAVLKARENGHHIYICTGCSKDEIEHRQLNLSFDGMICGNGCYVESDNEVIYHKCLSLDQCTHFVNWCNSRGLAHRLECNSGIYISADYEEKSYYARKKYVSGNLDDNKKPPKNTAMKFGNMYRSDVNKTAFVLNSYQDYLDAIEEFPDMEVGTWGGRGSLVLYGDTSAKNVSKYNGIKLLLEYLNSKDTTVAFGDSKSDIPMFNACDISVAMGNSSDEVKKIATYITDDVDDNGLYNGFKRLNII